jgi:hypothetical protein
LTQTKCRLRIHLKAGSAIHRFYLETLKKRGSASAHEAIRALVISGWLITEEAPTTSQRQVRNKGNLYIRVQLSAVANFSATAAVTFAEIALEKLQRPILNSPSLPNYEHPIQRAISNTNGEDIAEGLFGPDRTYEHKFSV